MSISPLWRRGVRIALTVSWLLQRVLCLESFRTSSKGFSYWLREVFHTPTCLRYQSACATTWLIRLWCDGVIVIEQDVDLISILFDGVYSRRLSNYITYWYKNTIKSSYFPRVIFTTIFSAKYRISTRLIIEKPVRRPIVPPTAARMLTNLAASSLVILSNVGVSKKILTKLKLLCSW